jgi:hypothetical protein
MQNPGTNTKNDSKTKSNRKVLRPASGLRMTNYCNVAILKIL